MAEGKLTREQLAQRCAREFQDGWIVNLGVGMPTLCSDYVLEGRRVIFHSENGVIGYGRGAQGDEVDPYVTNAGGQPVTLQPFAAFVSHAESFALVRSGRLDCGVLGAYQVAVNGDFANWKLPGNIGGGIGGAMDIASCAKRLFLMMDHIVNDQPRLLERCTLPITAPGVVKLVVTNLGVFEPTGEAFLMKEIAPGYSTEEVVKLTGAPVIVDPNLTEMTF